MKRLVAFVGVGVLSLAFMSSTCSMNSGQESQASSDQSLVAPTSGITFKKKSFEDAKAEAKKSGKLIFIDAYTDWCGPCKRMAATSFKDPKVGELFNKNFVNLKVEMEKDKDGPNLARKYGVKAYPTLLIVDGNGKLVKQSIGMKSSAQLIALANSVL
ncbi:MAG: hypothetical protein Crog4KO_02780 [Crocinitomicaceae bacterium]